MSPSPASRIATTGRIVDIGALDRYVQQHVLSIYDHSDLNTDVPDFRRADNGKSGRSTVTDACGAPGHLRTLLDGCYPGDRTATASTEKGELNDQ